MSHSTRPRALAALALSATLGLLPLLPAAAQRFTEATDVVAVEVPVQVFARDGSPVRGLRAEDFEVYEGKRKLPLTGFEVLDLNDPGRRDSVPAAARRHFLMLFDLSFSEPKSVIRARRAAAGVLSVLRPSDLVAVATYSASQGPQIVLGFSSDRAQIETALDTLGLPQLVDRNRDPLRLVLASQELQNEKRVAVGERRAASAASEDAVLEQLRDFNRQSQTADRTVQSNMIKGMTRSLADLAHLVGSVEGRKYVVYLSEGFDVSAVQGSVDADERDAMNTAAEEGRIWDVDPEHRYGNTSSGSAVEQMLEELRRADCVVEAVDIGGLRDAGDPEGHHPNGKDSLFQMARGTGGDFYENFNDLGAAMGRMLDRTAVTYVLAVQPDKIKLDGSWHPLRVEVKNGPGSRVARVAHRSGFYAPRPYATRSPIEKLLDAADQVMSGEESGPLAISVLATPFRFNGEKAYVPVLLEIEGNGLLLGTEGPAVPAEVYVYALDDTGAVHDYLTQTVGLDAGKVAPALRQSGLKFFGHLELAPGSYSLRVMARNGATGISGVRVVPLEVPAFDKPGPVLLAPLFPEAPGKWLMVREQGHGDQQQAPYPFMLQGQPFIPAALPVLAPGQEAPLALSGYDLGAGELKLQARVLGADDKDAGPAEVVLVEGERETGADGLVHLRGTFRTPQLAAGEYRLRITLTDASGQTHSSAARFAVHG